MPLPIKNTHMRHSFRLLARLLMLSPLLSTAQPAGGIFGRIDGRSYVSPGGHYRVTIPVLPELGGNVTDTQNVVVFQDDYNVHVSIAAFEMDATQRWELSTRGLKDYLSDFFTSLVMPDFSRMFPDASIESATFDPVFMGGTLRANILLPGGSMFAQQIAPLRGDLQETVAKRGNLVFIRHNVVYVVSVELTERIIEGPNYKRTTAEEDSILRERLELIVNNMTFAQPASG